MKGQLTIYIRFIGSYFATSLIFLLIMKRYAGGEGLYITFQPYVHLLFLTGFAVMLLTFLINRKKFKEESPYRIHLISLLALFLPTLIYQLLFGDDKQVQISEYETYHYQKIYYYYFIFVTQAYLFGTLILLTSSIAYRNKRAVLYCLASLGALSGYFFMVV